MQERAIHISSVNRQKIGRSKAEDFIIKFDPVLKLQSNMTHEIALDKATMTYSWHNISDQYQNNEIKYSPDGGTSWETVKFVDGMYTYSDLNDYLHQYMKKKGHKTTDAKKDDVYYIYLTFVLSTCKILIQIDNNYQLDLKYVERYEGVIFDLETALNTTVANNAHQKKDGYKFVVDNSREVTPFDWYNARISLDFKVVLLANGGNIAVADHNGIVNGSYSLLKHFDIKLNGKKVYDCNDANHAVNIKNLLEYSPSYADKTASNEFFYLDTSRNAEEREFEVSGTNQLAKRRAAYNKGFALRKALLGVSSTVKH